MNKFLFKSTDADFKKMFSIIETVQKNVLYMTYSLDRLHKEINCLMIDKDLQKQANAYFEDNPLHPEDKQDLD